jgi:hypothetical protein
MQRLEVSGAVRPIYRSLGFKRLRKIDGRIEVKVRRGRRCNQLLDDLKERRGYSHLKEEALDRTMWRAGFGRGYEPGVMQNTQ